MALITEEAFIRRAELGGRLITKSVEADLRSYTALTKTQYDFFLSHSFLDAKVIDGIAVTLEDLGFSVYVDWREDPLMSRTNVTSSTANTIKLRMIRCSYMLYAFSENATTSKWVVVVHHTDPHFLGNTCTRSKSRTLQTRVAKPIAIAGVRSSNNRRPTGFSSFTRTARFTRHQL